MLDHMLFAVLTVLAGSSLVSAHGHITQWTVNGQTYKGFDPNMPEGYKGAQRPTDNSEANGYGWGPANYDTSLGKATNDFTGAVACGGVSPGMGLDTWDLDAGSEVTATWTTGWPEAHLGKSRVPIPRRSLIIRSGHGVYGQMPRNCDGVPGESLKWFKIGEATWDGKEWASAKITADPNWTFTIPSDLAPGPYLVRHEIMALHFDDRQEIYPVCFQANLKGAGSAVPTDTTTFPAAYEAANYKWLDYSVPWDKRPAADYIAPGPAVYVAGGGSNPASPVVLVADNSAVPSASAPSASASSAPVFDAASIPPLVSKTDVVAAEAPAVTIVAEDAEDGPLSSATPTSSVQAPSSESGLAEDAVAGPSSSAAPPSTTPDSSPEEDSEPGMDVSPEENSEAVVDPSAKPVPRPSSSSRSRHRGGGHGRWRDRASKRPYPKPTKAASEDTEDAEDEYAEPVEEDQGTEEIEE